MAAKRRRRRRTEWSRQRLECVCLKHRFSLVPDAGEVIGRRLSHKKAAVKPPALHTLARDPGLPVACPGLAVFSDF